MFGGRCRGLDSLEGHLVECDAKVVAHGVHARGVVTRVYVERDDLL